MIHHNSHLCYDIYDKLNKPNPKTGSLPFIVSKLLWYLFLSVSKNIFICFIINHEFYVITFWMHYTLFIIIYGRNKVFCLTVAIFHVSDFLRLFMMAFRYSLILLRCSSKDSIWFLSRNQYNCYSKNYLLLLV